MLTDITTAQTRLLYKGEWAEKLAKHECDGKLMMENTLSRKKQVGLGYKLNWYNYLVNIVKRLQKCRRFI